MNKIHAIILFIFLCTILTSCHNNALGYKALSKNYKTTTGHIAAMNCANHGEFYYAFYVNGKRYSNRGLDHGTDCGALKEGDELDVYYNPESPSINADIDPSAAYRQESGFYIPEWLWVLFPIIIAISLAFLLALKHAGSDDKKES
ncbi:hypothetical protein [Chromobacterium sp. IIBBL 290-4]|uniref:DUF3592 domain-containing protein n=1 Tax=Chromobacterium sp. IIBBL 290-4 TaxID=2953890 RepID=UPI0020B8F4B3|nr:hypothetical protein [Chromobacterium sp. IIBBL 290-4]UTH73226.1 hypothetical protein NKT35_17055 [Chromobacterium sp. IIBBL 290-4]